MRRRALKRRSAMAGGGYGGDSSVKWWLDIDNVKSFSGNSKGKKQHYEGVDDTPRTLGGGTFTITITLPREKNARDKLRHKLRAAASASTGSVILTIPIEDVKHG